MKPLRISLSVKLILAFLFLSLVPLGIIIYFNTTFTSTHLKEDADQQLSSTAKLAASNINIFLTGGLDHVQSTAALAEFEEYLLLPATERKGSEIEQEVYQNLQATVLLDPSYITSVGVMDLNGVNLIDTDPTQIGEEEKEKEFFVQAVETKASYTSNAELDEGDYSIYFSAPIFDKNNKVLGIVRIRYDANILQDILLKTAKDSNIEGIVIDLFDENHVALAVTDAPEDILKILVLPPAEKLKELQEAGRILEGSVEDIALNDPDLEAHLENAELVSTFTIEAEGEEAATAFVEGKSWIVLTGQPQSIYQAPLQEQLRVQITIGLALLVIVSALAFLLARSISSPIIDLSGVAKEISNGNVDIQAKVQTTDEIGELAKSFNEMTATLRSNLTDLERRANEVTAISEVSRRLSSVLDKQRLLIEVVDQIKSSLDYYHVHIYLLDKDSGDLIMSGGTGEVGQTMLERKHRISKGRGLVGRAAETGAPVLVPDTLKDTSWLPNPLLPETASEIAVPILSETGVVGVLDVQNNIQNSLSERDVELLQSIAYQVSIALKNADTYMEAQSQAERENIINEINRKIQNTSSVEQALQVAIRELGSTLGAKDSRIVLHLPDSVTKESR